MSNPYEMFEINEKLENEEGIWAEYPVKGHPDKAFKVRFVHSGDTNVHYREALRARLKPLNYRIQHDMVSDEEFEAIQQKVFADKIIKDWQCKDSDGNFVQGIYGQDFAIIPFDKANVVATFANAPRLFKDIKKQSDQLSTFKAEEIKVDSKN